MIYVVGGDIGAGKTLWSMEMMEAAVNAGRPVYTNIKLKPECPFMDKVAFVGDSDWPIYEEKPNAEGLQAWWDYVTDDALFVCDEADLYFDCTDNSKMGRDARAAHKMIRKVGWDAIYIVQNVPNLYVRIRRLASRFIICEHNWRTERIFRIAEMVLGADRAIYLSRYIRAEFGSESLDQFSKRGEGYYTYREAKRYFGWYDTKQLLGDFALRRATYHEKERQKRDLAEMQAAKLLPELDDTEVSEMERAIGLSGVEYDFAGSVASTAGQPSGSVS